jgi:dTDP-glucose 4,6-dehydratase
MKWAGGAGFLGSNLCERPLDDGAEVIALDNLLTGTPANVEHLLHDPGFTLVMCDVVHDVHAPGRLDQVLHFALRRRPSTTCSCRSRSPAPGPARFCENR